MNELDQVARALSIVSKQAPCAHENSDFNLGTGTTWARCHDCGITFEQQHLERAQIRQREFDDAVSVLATLREDLLEEYAKRGDARGALNSAWVYSQGEWDNADLKLWTNNRDHDDGSISWEYGEFDGNEEGEEFSPRKAMRSAEIWRAAHPLDVVPGAVQTMLPKELEALRDILRDWNRLAQSKSEQMGFNAVHKNLHDVLLDAHEFTTEQANDLLKKLGIK